MEEVGFKSVQILKTDVLGTGSYGTVCKATCDDLTCAAKILHLVAVDGGTTREQFEKECKFLSSIRHPNIVLYLGTSQDQDTNLPALLMELMDESLTRLLERSQCPLPLNREVDVCGDIALALSFLHSNGIIHRDLSSNNVLMIGDSHAKVTDFGMAMLWDTATVGRSSLTKRPGCSVYMPPEADSTYSNTLDCFSFGVLIIQVLTRLFPDPSDSFQVVEVNDPKFPNGIEIRVPEAERRKSHLAQVSADHLLLPLALDCITDKPDKRPSSRELCSRIKEMKSSSVYADSISADLKSSSSAAEVVLEDIDKLVQEMQCFTSEETSQSQTSGSLGNSTDPVEVQSLDGRRSVEGQLSCKSVEQSAAIEEVARLKVALDEAQEKLKEKDAEIQNYNTQLEEYERHLSAKITEREIEETKSDSVKDKVVETTEVPEPEAESALPQSSSSEAQAQSAAIDQGAFELPNWKDCCEELQRQLEKNKGEIDNLKQEIETKSRLLKEKDVMLEDSERRSRSLADELKNFEKNFSKRGRAPSVMPLSTVSIKFKKEGKAPYPISRSTETLVTSGNVIFLRPGGTKEILAFNIECDTWSKFPESPVSDSSLTLIRRNISLLGGKVDQGTFSNKVLSLISSGGSRKWVEIYPRMRVKRSNLTTVVCQAAVVAAGGENKEGFLPTVEVLDTSKSVDTLAWERVSDLPEPLAMASGTLCAGLVYLVGGWVEKMTPTQSVYAISAEKLLGSESSKTATWSNVATLPTKGSTSISVKGRLLSVGGRDSHQPASAIHIYDPERDLWEVLAHMKQPRHQCYACVVDDKFVAIGGWMLNKKQLLTETKTIEISTIL